MFSSCYNRQGCYDTLFSSYDSKEASTPCKPVACPSTTLPPLTDFLSLTKQLKNYHLWTLSNFLTETLHSLHVHSINTYYLLPTNVSLHSCILLFWIVTVYLQTYLFIIFPFNLRIISSLNFSKCTVSFFSQLRIHFRSPVYRSLVLL